jgi:hypothetical protein
VSLRVLQGGASADVRWGNRTFDQASPNAIPVGSQADLSDLRIKSEKEDCESLSLFLRSLQS